MVQLLLYHVAIVWFCLFVIASSSCTSNADKCTYTASSLPSTMEIVGSCDTSGGAKCAAECNFKCKYGYTWSSFAYKEVTSGQCPMQERITAASACGTAATALGYSVAGSPSSVSSGPPGCYWDGSTLKLSTGTGDCSSSNKCICLDRSVNRNPTCPIDGQAFTFPGCQINPDGFALCSDPLYTCQSSSASMAKIATASSVQCNPAASDHNSSTCSSSDATALARCCHQSCKWWATSNNCPQGMQPKDRLSSIPCAGATCGGMDLDTCCQQSGSHLCTRNQLSCQGNDYFFSEWRDSAFSFNAIGNQPCEADARPFIHDVNKDGHKDLVCGTLSGAIKYFQQDGTTGALAAKTGSDNPFDGFLAQIKSSNEFGNPCDPCHSTIWITRWNDDNYDDALVGTNIDGLLLFLGTSSGFQTPTKLLVPQLTASTTPSVNPNIDLENVFAAAADFDGDQDLDLFVGGFSTGNNGVPRVLYFERQSQSSNDLVYQPSITAMFSVTSPSSWSLPYPVDIDGDMDLDMVVGGAWTGRLQYLERSHDGGYLLRDETQSPIYSVSAMTPGSPFDNGPAAKPGLIGDFDGDQIIDVIVGDGAQIKMYKGFQGKSYTGRGGLASPFYGFDFAPSINGANNGMGTWPQLVDWDGDNDMDLLVGINPMVLLWTQVSPGNFKQTNFPSSPLAKRSDEMGGALAPVAVDWDGDNDMDLMVGATSSGCPFYYERTGATTLVERNCDSAQNPFKNLAWTGQNPPPEVIQRPAIVDWNGDGLLDIVAGTQSRFGTGNGCIKLYLNKGGTPPTWELQTGSNDPFASNLDNDFNFACNGDGVCSITPTVVDYDGDNDLDILGGFNLVTPGCNMAGQVKYWERLGTNVFAGGQWMSANPPEFLDVGDYASPQVVQIDNSGQVDLLVGWDAGLKVYLRGWCEVPESCSSKGVCNSRTGICSCSEGASAYGYTPPNMGSVRYYDCSGCDPGYFKYPTQQDPNNCVRCPFDPDKNTDCWDRGVCNDDANALQALPNDYSKSLKIYSKGDGSCACAKNGPNFTDSSPFYGSINNTQCRTGSTTCTTTTHPGRTTCSEGECPKGFELLSAAAGDDGPARCWPCAVGWFKAEAGNGPYNASDGRCVVCPAGKFNNGTGSSACTSCDAGTYQSVVGMSFCIDCAAGSFAPAGSPQCTSCAAGKSSQERQASCDICAAGKYSEAASALCSDCAVGKVSPQEAGSCTQCNAGKFSPGSAASCTDCNAGSYAGLGAGSCTPCDNGWVAPVRSSQCTQCPAGKRSSGGRDSCVDCPAGQFAAAGSLQCQICVAGRSAPAVSSQCGACPAGTYASSGQASCTQCSAGKYSTEIEKATVETCVDCAANTYNSLTGQGAQAACLPCPANTQTSGTAATQQAQCKCLPGHGYLQSGNGFTCPPCAAGYYKEGINHNACLSCVDLIPGSSSAVSSSVPSACHCPPGRYKTSSGCEDCPVGFYCPGTVTDDTRRTCPGGATTLTNRASHLDACLCMEGYYLFQSNCEQCAAGRYKEGISDSLVCPGVCADIAENSTSAKGSRSNASCVCKPNYVDPTPNDGMLQCEKAAAGTQASGSETLSVPSVATQISLNGVTPPTSDDDKLKVAQALADKVVEMLGADKYNPPICALKTQTATHDIFGCGDLDITLNRTTTEETSSRRLSSNAVHASFVVRQATQQQASTAASLFRPEQLVSLLATESAFNGLTDVSTVSAPVAGATITSCPANKAFPLGVAFVSLQASCKCKAGFEPAGDGQSCTPCRFNFWKSVAKDASCEICPTNRETLAIATDTQSKCYCKAGYYAAADGTCVTCPADAYCPFDDNDAYVQCGTGKSTIGDGKTQFEDCLCRAGWGVVNVTKCKLCESGSFKSIIDNAFCNSCPQASRMQSEIGSTKVEECSCQKGYYYDYTRSSCEACQVPGIQCDGGFYKYGSSGIDLSMTISNLVYGSLSSEQLSGISSQSRATFLQELNESVSADDISITLGSGSVVINASIALAKTQDAAAIYAALLGSPTLIPMLVAALNTVNGMNLATSSVSVTSSNYYTPTLSIDQVRPYARPGFFLTGVLRVQKCRDSTAYKGTVCLGGNESSRPCLSGCNCVPGMDGFSCENCIKGYTRAKSDVDCRTCDDLGPTWWLLLPLVGAAFATSALYFILTALALAAGQSSKRVHTALLRMWQSWVLSMVVLKQFNIADIGMFAWGEEAAQFAYLEDNPKATPEETQGYMAKLSFVFPKWFKQVAEVLYGLSEFVPQIGAPAESLQCFAEKVMSEESATNGKYYLVAAYWALYPIAILIITYFLAVLVVYCIFPPLDRRNLFPPSDPRIFKVWAFDRVKHILEKSVRMLGCPEEDIEDVMGDMKALLATQQLTMAQIQKMAGHPIAGIGAVCGRMDTTAKLLARRIIVKIFKKRLVGAAKTAATKMFAVAAGGHHNNLPMDPTDTEGEDVAEGVVAKGPHALMWLDPWPKVCANKIEAIVSAIPIDSLCDGMKDPIGFGQTMMSSASSGDLLPIVLHPFFRLFSLRHDEEMELDQVDEIWEHISEGLGEIQLGDLTDCDPAAFLDKIGGFLGGHITSVFWAVKNKKWLMKGVHKEDPEMSLEASKSRWRDIFTFCLAMSVFDLMQMSQEEILAAAAMQSGTATKKQQAVIDEMRDELEDLVDANILDTAEDVDINEDYCIFGIWHRNPSMKQFFIDSKPLFYIALYTLWYQLAKELLSQINCDNFPVVSDTGLTEIQLRWTYHADWQCFESPHIVVGGIASAGLAVWSVGYMLFLAFMVYRNRRRIADPEVARQYAYFVQGYEIEWCHWDVFVKRADLFCTILISATNIAADKKAKLLLYACLAAAALIMHAAAKPFDNRKGELLDRFEFTGLMVRFITFSVIELCLVFNPSLWVTIASIGFAAIVTAWYAVSIWITIIVEYIADLTGKGQKASPDDVMKMLDEGMKGTGAPSTNPAAIAQKKLMKGCKWIAGFACKSLITMAMKIMVRITGKVQALEQGALSVHFGKNCELKIMSREERKQLVKSGYELPDKEKPSCLQRYAQISLSSFFHQTDECQREFMSTVISAYYTHVICTMESPTLPPRSLECFLAMSAALKMAKLDGNIAADASLGDKHKAVDENVGTMISLMYDQGSAQKERISDALEKKKSELAVITKAEAEEKRAKSKEKKKKTKTDSASGSEDDIERKASNVSAQSKKSDEVKRSISLLAKKNKASDIVDEMTIEELESTLDAFRLNAEELNEMLMVLYRVKLDKSKRLFEKVVKLFEHVGVKQVQRSMSMSQAFKDAGPPEDPPDEQSGPKGVPRETPIVQTPSFRASPSTLTAKSINTASSSKDDITLVAT